MAFNGSGVFVRLYNWVTDKANGVNITASKMDAEMDGFAAGLSNCVTRDGQGGIASSFNPAVDNTYSLGSGALRWVALNGIDINLMSVLGAHKSTLTSRASTTTPANDPDLVVVLSAGIWRIDATLFFNAIATSGVTPGIRAGLNFAGNTNNSRFVIYGSSDSATANPFAISLFGTNQTQVVSYAAQASAQVDTMIINGLISVIGSTQGLSVSWAQNNSSSNATQLLENSFLTARRIG